MENAQSGHDESRERKGLAEKIDMKLKKYYKALLLSRDIAHLDGPSKRVVLALHNELHGKSGIEDRLDGDESRPLENEHDLVALKPPKDRDVISTALRNHWPFPRSRHETAKRKSIRYSSERHLTILLSAISISFAAVLVVGPILALNFSNNADARLGIAIAFIVLFALSLSISTGISRDNVFIATATYSAVLVVFVSENLGGDLGNVTGTSGNVTGTPSAMPG